MNIDDFITEPFFRIGDALPVMADHDQAILSLSELVTIGVLQAMKNVSYRPFYHWLKDNTATVFPNRPTVPGPTAWGLLAVFLRRLRDVQRWRYGREYLG